MNPKATAKDVTRLGAENIERGSNSPPNTNHTPDTLMFGSYIIAVRWLRQGGGVNIGGY